MFHVPCSPCSSYPMWLYRSESRNAGKHVHDKFAFLSDLQWWRSWDSSDINHVCKTNHHLPKHRQASPMQILEWANISSISNSRINGDRNRFCFWHSSDACIISSWLFMVTTILRCLSQPPPARGLFQHHPQLTTIRHTIPRSGLSSTLYLEWVLRRSLLPSPYEHFSSSMFLRSLNEDLSMNSKRVQPSYRFECSLSCVHGLIDNAI